MAETITEKKILRLPEVLKLTGLSRTTDWRRVAAGEFPVPLRLGGPKSRAVGWRTADIDRWIDDLGTG